MRESNPCNLAESVAFNGTIFTGIPEFKTLSIANASSQKFTSALLSELKTFLCSPV